jgi:hypothetical protein
MFHSFLEFPRSGLDTFAAIWISAARRTMFKGVCSV